MDPFRLVFEANRYLKETKGKQPFGQPKLAVSPWVSLLQPNGVHYFENFHLGVYFFEGTLLGLV